MFDNDVRLSRSSHVSLRVAWKFKHFGVYGQVVSSSLQTVLMKLWAALSETPDMLADKGLGDVYCHRRIEFELACSL